MVTREEDDCDRARIRDLNIVTLATDEWVTDGALCKQSIDQKNYKLP